MVAHPIAVIHDGVVEIPEELKGDPRFQDGARLALVPQPLVESAHSPRAQQEKNAEAWQRLIDLRGFFADFPGNANDSLEEERKRELKEEARWFCD